MIKSICLVRLSALGDVLMCVPLVRTLQRHFPQVSITWVIAKPAYFLVEGMDGVTFIVIDKPASLADYWRFRQSFRSKKFDVLLALQPSFRANLLYPFIHATRKIGYSPPFAKDGHRLFIHETIKTVRCHMIENLFQFATALGVRQTSLSWNLPISDADHAWARAHLLHINRPILIVNPAASKSERTWAISRYIEVIQFAQTTLGLSVVLTGGPGVVDKSLGDAIVSAVPEVTNLIGQTKPKELMAVMKKARVVLCPDTGPAHMAVAVGTPVIALHAVTNVDVSGPYAYRQYAVNAYPEALLRCLGKTINTCRWGTQVHGEHVMDFISVDAVKSKLHHILLG